MAGDRNISDREREFRIFLEVLLGGCEGSHLCGNPPCSDPFHVFRESRTRSMNRNACLLYFRPKDGDHDCEHWPPCKVSMRWADQKNDWKQLRADIVEKARALSRPAWICSNPDNRRHALLMNEIAVHYRYGRGRRENATCLGSWTQVDGKVMKPSFAEAKKSKKSKKSPKG